MKLQPQQISKLMQLLNLTTFHECTMCSLDPIIIGLVLSPHDNNVEAYALCNNCTGEELGNILDELYIQKHEDRIVHC